MSTVDLVDEVDLRFVEANDPTVTFTINEDGSAVDLAGTTVEVFVKDDSTVADDDATKYSTDTGEVTLTDASNGKVQVDFLSGDVGGTDAQVYRLDVLSGGRRRTYVHGRLLKVDV